MKSQKEIRLKPSVTTAFANSFFFTIEASREVRMIKNNYNCMFNEEKLYCPVLPSIAQYCPLFRVLPGAGKPGFSRRVFPGAGFSCQPCFSIINIQAS